MSEWGLDISSSQYTVNRVKYHLGDKYLIVVAGPHSVLSSLWNMIVRSLTATKLYHSWFLSGHGELNAFDSEIVSTRKK